MSSETGWLVKGAEVGEETGSKVRIDAVDKVNNEGCVFGYKKKLCFMLCVANRTWNNESISKLTTVVAYVGVKGGVK